MDAGHDFIAATPADLDAVAAGLLALPGERVWAFYGPVGAGKTAAVQAMCRALGVTDETASPSFALVHPYRTANGGTVYHLDLYRLERAEEAWDLGLEDLLDGPDPVLIEWPERVADALEAIGAWHVTVRARADGSRVYRASRRAPQADANA